MGLFRKSPASRVALVAVLLCSACASGPNSATAEPSRGGPAYEGLDLPAVTPTSSGPTQSGGRATAMPISRS